MNVAIDAFPLTEEKASGIHNYLKSILFSPAFTDAGNTFYLYCKNDFSFPHDGSVVKRFARQKGRRVKSFENTLWLFTRGMKIMRGDNIDVFWGTRHMIPPFLPKGAKKVLTVHDVAWRYFPETMDRYNLLVMKLLAARSIRTADHIIADSHATARSIARFFAVPSSRMTVIHLAADQFSPLGKEKSAAYISRKYDTKKRYVLTVGTIEPRKNLITLIRVFAALKCPDIQLLIAGAGGWNNSSLYKEYKELGLSEERVKFLGFVPDADMNRLYSGAALFVFPSIYEGFGMPPLEAMSSGTPVISSDAASLPEVMGEAGILLAPTKVNVWRKTILEVLGNDKLVRTMVQKGLEQAALFSWRKSAEETLRVFNLVNQP